MRVAAAALLLTIPCGLAGWRAGATPAHVQEPPSRAGGQRPSTSYIPYAEAQPLFHLLRAELLPADLRDGDDAARRARWPEWVERHDSAIRGRLRRGDEDTVANLIFFGTRFTSERRLLYTEIPTLPDDQESSGVVRRRIDDMIDAITQRSHDERMRFVHDVVTSTGIDPGTAGGRERARDYLRTLTERAIDDRRRYDEAIASAKQLPDPVASSIGYATLFHDRGLSSDASFLGDYALHETLDVLREQRVLTPGTVRRVAVVGPGLDVADKRQGYDFFPPQTFQPFAAIDSLVRLGLASSMGVHITVLDVNPRVVRHVDAARERARMGEEYVVRLPRDTKERWTTLLAEYWERFGHAIGAARSAQAPDADHILVRSVSIRPDVVLTIAPQDVNLVVERLDLSLAERFDLIVTTNILVYYDVFEQALALKNIARMLRPGGLLLSNDFVVPDERMGLGGSVDVSYTSTEGDRITWYRHLAP
jgi:SAM-dependent methyltransferase